MSIAAGIALISHLSYRVLLLLAAVGVVGACAVVILTRPAPEPAANPEPNPRKNVSAETPVPASLSGRRSKAVR